MAVPGHQHGPGRIREASRASLSTDQPSPSSSSALRSATRSISGSVASPSDVQATRRGRDLGCPGRVATHISGVTPAPPAAPPAPPVVLAETRFLDHGNFGGLQHPKVSVIKEPAWLRPERGRAAAARWRAGALRPDGRRRVCLSRGPGAGLDRALADKPLDVRDCQLAQRRLVGHQRLPLSREDRTALAVLADQFPLFG